MFLPMLYRTKVSCIFKKHFLSFMIPTLFARNLKESVYLSNTRKRVGAIKDKIKVILREVGLMNDFEYVIKSTSN